MLSLISNIRLDRVKVQKNKGFRTNLMNYSTSELNNEYTESINLFSSKNWLKMYR